LKQQLKQIQESFAKEQQEMQARFERMVREQQAQIKALQQQIAAATNAVAGVMKTNQALAAPLQEMGEKVAQVVEAQKKVRPSEFNPSIGFVGDTLFSYNRRAATGEGPPRVGGWDVFQRGMELNVAASVDPFAQGYAVLNASADAQTGEANVEVEEAALETASLPANLELKAGRFFGEFGRLSYIHDHELPFVNRPLVLNRYIGGESQTEGVQASWLTPLPQYLDVTAGLGDKFGEDSNSPGAYRAFSQLDAWGRVSTYFDLSPNWQLEGGVSGLWGPRTGSAEQAAGGTAIARERRLAGVDIKVSYVPLRNNQFRSLVWGTELLHSGNRYLFDPDGVPGSADEYQAGVGCWGLYSYATYKWHRQWSGGCLFDWLEDPQGRGRQTFAFSPYLTWAISHWHFLRLQYTHTDYSGADLRANDAVFLQWCWIIGSHAHGWQAR